MVRSYSGVVTESEFSPTRTVNRRLSSSEVPDTGGSRVSSSTENLRSVCKYNFPSVRWKTLKRSRSLSEGRESSSSNFTKRNNRKSVGTEGLIPLNFEERGPIPSMFPEKSSGIKGLSFRETEYFRRGLVCFRTPALLLSRVRLRGKLVKLS